MNTNSKDRKKRQNNTRYDAVYDALIYLNNYHSPLTIYRISTNKNALSLLLSKQLINPVKDKDKLINTKHEDAAHYVISQKGIEYIKRYESFQQLIS